MAVSNVTQPAFSSGIISTELFSRIDYNKLRNGLKQCENFLVRPAGGVEYRTGTEYICDTKYPTKASSLIPFIYNRSDGLCLEFGDGYIRFIKNGYVVTANGSPYEVETEYLASEVSAIKYCQHKNSLYLVHPNHPPAVLTRTTDTNWTLRNLNFTPQVASVSSVSISANTATNSDTVVKTKWKYAASLVNSDDQEGMVTYSNEIESDVDILNQTIKVEITVPSGDFQEIRLYRIKGGVYYLCYVQEYISGQNAYTITDISYALDTTTAPREEFTEFQSANHYPSAVGYWNQRLILGGTNNDPTTFWMSCVGYPEDFTTTIVNAADESIELTFNSGTNDAITDFIPMDDLIVFTEGKIWRVVGTSASDMNAYIESYSGSSGLRPHATKKSVLYVDSSLNTTSNFVYSYELNGYVGQNLDILSRQLVDGYRLNDITYRDTPYGVMYSVRNDGTLLGLTYLREENIYAWHKHTTRDGKFKAVCSVDKNENDELYVIVERNGKRMIELFKKPINEEQGIDDCWHLDCASRTTSTWNTYKTGETTSSSKTYYAYYGTQTDYMNLVLDKTVTKETVYVENQAVGETVYKRSGNTFTDYSTVVSINDNYLEISKYGTTWPSEWGIPISVAYGLVPQDDAGESVNVPPRRVVFIRTSNGAVVIVVPWEHSTITESDILGGSFYSGTYSSEYNTAYWTTAKNHGNYNVGVWAPAIGKQISAGFVWYNGDTKVRSVPNATLQMWGWGSYSQGIVWKETRTLTSGYAYERQAASDYTIISYVNTISYAYVQGNPTVGGFAYDNIGDIVGHEITSVSGDNFVADGKTYELYEKAATETTIGDLSRFNGMKVSAVIDGDEYNDISVSNGKAQLPKTGANVLIGLPYEGIIEMIPYDSENDKGNSTVGFNRKINDGIIYYHRTRGLWYGKDTDHLYQIKTYKDTDFSEVIPLESGKQTVKVADGFTIDNTFVVVQKSPFPALIQSITLGATYNGKN